MQISAILKTKGQSVATIGQDVTVATAVAELARHNVGALVVSDDGLSVDGIISERDVARAPWNASEAPCWTSRSG